MSVARPAARGAGVPAARAAGLLVVPALCTLALLLVPAAAKASALLVLLATGASLLYLASFVSPTVLFSLAVVFQAFSGNSFRLGLPVGPDRVLLLAAVVALVARAFRGELDVRLRWRPVHFVVLLLGAVALSSAAWGGTLLTTGGVFALLDRLGFVPFLAFFLAPLLYRTAEQRNVLLVCLVALGGYLGVVALLEGLGLGRLAWPGYIADRTVGLHFGRARGPFLEAVANGQALFHCAIACGVAVRLWRSTTARWTAAFIGALCLVGTLFTLTRAVWLGTLLGLFAAFAVVPSLRRRLPAVLALVVGAVALALALVPGLGDDVTSRSSAQRPLWDRYNTNLAAVRIVEERPLLGVGWQNFAEDGTAYLRQSERYPITGVGIEVHNVFLSHAAELGLFGASLYLAAVTLAVGGALVRSPRDRTLAPWRVGLLSLALSWLVVASFGPLSYALPNTLLWLWAGIVLAPTLMRPLPERPGVPA